MTNDLWDQVKEQLKKKVSAPSYETWLAKLNVDIIGNDMVVTAESEFNRDWVEGRYKDLIAITALEVTGQSYNVKILPTINQPHIMVDELVDYRQVLNLSETFLEIDGIEIKAVHAPLVKKRLLGEISLTEFLNEARRLSDNKEKL